MKRLLVATLLLAPVAAGAQENTTTVIAGRVVLSGGAPLAHAAITINGKNPQFTDSLGRFRVEGIASGTVTLRARRIGFSPAEQTVRIARGDTVQVTFEMSRLAIPLPAMRTIARACENPGAPGRDSDPGLVQLYQQLLENAETFRLLSLAHPYVYSTQRQFVRTFRDSVIERSPLEAISGTSERSWSYEAGKMVFESGAKTNMRIPTLPTFAEPSFAKAHCFFYGGEVEIDGQSLVRIDFAPDRDLKAPDVSGSIYLDPTSYQIRRSEIQLSKVPYHLTGEMTAYTVTTWFTEISPGIPIIGALKAEMAKLRDGESVTELQQVVHVNFPRGKP